MWRMSECGEMAREDDFGVQASPVARKRPVGQTQPGALLTSPPWGASGQPGNVAARPRVSGGCARRSRTRPSTAQLRPPRSETLHVRERGSLRGTAFMLLATQETF